MSNPKSTVKAECKSDNEKAVMIALAIRHDEIMEYYYKKWLEVLESDK